MIDARWKAMKTDLQKETEAISHRSGDVLLIDTVAKSDFDSILTASLAASLIRQIHKP